MKAEETRLAPTPAARLKGGLWGVLVGDALGVPVEFTNRGECDDCPVTGMRGHGTHDQPAGTWSDDGAMTLCTAEVLTKEFDAQRLAESFLGWYHDGRWTARGQVFDVGVTTREALRRFAQGTPAESCGGSDVRENGNGALMRILPVALRYADRSPSNLLSIATAASRITHAHIRSGLACGIYCVMAARLLGGASPVEAYAYACEVTRDWFDFIAPGEAAVFERLLAGKLANVGRADIESSGYVLDTLEAAIWCVLRGGDFATMTLRAVNLGADTDTVGAVTGGLAGLVHGIDGIPLEWRQALPRQGEVGNLIERFSRACLAKLRSPST